ncbi:MAG: hypoxanthine phosphoribosyltransferase [Dietzia sp.]|jgi:hypoxanthine phosphoribosyltransferase|uniref:Hypoxanthine phosphoribosyltransferase n=1 Tax=Dietzia cercidiphylli TaxID=498199 RepID=A0ABN2IF72_9ACTN|nr:MULTISPECIES: hypoxanthine phosphoribosyltransferase [Dietzia]MBB1030279.1 hypoxanthine phosphoribosyltransferase [Dietzia sp. SLG310A2-38A2]MBB1034792.1 hypoxanthine phosphoribosyltransferase [Dietzia sp. CQ4]MBB1041024.1 hypoxanthine phosphoribosyltransferase [Dietzia sp. Cai40]MBB1045850.1 hypoxanthine phosphoribosyltransferase [Dietzia sp. DQ11-44]MBB1049186.1 hypoxanthine phosphoribosyltransferase [Dietzia cercidiphylli]
MSTDKYADEIESVLIDTDVIRDRIAEMGATIGERYRDSEQEVVLVAVLKGAAIFVSDFARALTIPSELEFMAVSSYGSSTSSSGVVRILKDLDRDIADRDVIIVEDIIDSGLTLSWLMRNLRTRNPRSLEIVTLLRKPDAVKADLDILEIGFDIPNEFVVGYGLDFAERYRDLPYIGRLHPRMYS